MSAIRRASGRAMLTVALVVMLAVIPVACGSDDDDDATATTASQPTLAAAAQASSASTPTVNVIGEGRVSIAPDIAVLSLGVTARDRDLQTAQDTATMAMESVRNALLDAGVAEVDLKTTTYSIYPEQDYNQPGHPVVAYNVTQMVTAKVRQIDRAGTVIEAAIDAGANQISGIWFALDDQSDATRQARELAVADARERAEHLASLSNATLGPIQAISEGYSSSTPVVYDTGAEEGAMSDARIDPGQLEVVVTVNVSYALQ